MLFNYLLAPVMAATAFAALGCGGSAKTQSTVATVMKSASAKAKAVVVAKSTPPLSRGELISRADGICARLSAEKHHNSILIKTIQAIKQYLPQFAIREQSAVGELARLTPPSSMEKDWGQFITGYRMLANSTTKLGEFVQSHTFGEARHLYGASTRIEHATFATARHAGFKSCSQQ
jgi:hypothetical protein